MSKLLDLCFSVAIATVAYRLTNIAMDIATDRVATAIVGKERKAA